MPWKGTVKLTKTRPTDPQDVAFESAREPGMLRISLGQSTST